MRREAAAAALAGDLKGTAGTSTWLIGIVAVWRNRASRRGDWVGDGAVTEEAMRFSLTRERDGPQLQITRPQFRDRSWAAERRTHPAGYYALKSDPKVGDGQAVTVKPCQWNQLDGNSSAIDF